jgi:anti-anti-sigma regulatory factor
MRTAAGRMHDHGMTLPTRSRVTMFAERRAVVTVGGTLDESTVPDLERLVADGLEPVVDVLVLDLAAVEDAAPEAVTALVRVQARCAAESVGLRLVAGKAVRAAVAADPAARASLPLG